MDGKLIFEEIKKARWDRIKEMVFEPQRITMTRNVYEELERECTPYIIVHAPKKCEEPKCSIFGMEIEVIDDSVGCFSIGGLMRGINL